MTTLIVSGAEAGAIPARSRHCVQLDRELPGRGASQARPLTSPTRGTRNPQGGFITHVAPEASPAPKGTVFRRLTRSWNRRDWWEFSTLAAAIAILHVVGFASLVLLVAPHHYQVGTQVFGIGLGVTAYTFGLRHAFDADHIAAIDNTTRKLTADGAKPKSVGFWFAMGHSTMVLAMAVLVIAATKVAGALINDDSPTRHVLGIAGTLASGLFLYLIGIINVVALTITGCRWPWPC